MARYHGDNELIEEIQSALTLPEDDCKVRCFELKTKYSFAIPSATALLTIKQYSPNGVLEVGAGQGYWAHLLANLDVSVVATDIKPQLGVDVQKGSVAWFDVSESHSEEATKEWSGQGKSLLCCWPDGDHPQNEPRNYLWWSSLYHADLTGFGTVIVVGDGPPATDNMFKWTFPWRADGKLDYMNMFHYPRSGWYLAHRERVPNWPGCYDALYVFKRIPQQSGGTGDGDLSAVLDQRLKEVFEGTDRLVRSALANVHVVDARGCLEDAITTYVEQKRHKEGFALIEQTLATFARETWVPTFRELCINAFEDPTPVLSPVKHPRTRQ